MSLSTSKFNLSTIVAPTTSDVVDVFGIMDSLDGCDSSCVFNGWFCMELL